MKPQRIRWTKDEDSVLSRLVNEMGSKDWKTISEAFHKTGNESRSRKQIRERWTGYLDPKLDKLPWTLQEELELFERHKELGNKWALIAQKLPGRAESVVKNHFYAVLTRTIRRRKKGFEGKVPFEKHNAPSHILHDLRSKYARQLLKMAKASAVVTSPANEPCRLGMELDKEKPMFQLPEVSELKAVMDFEKWGYSVDWKCLGGEGENGGAERSIKAPSDEIIVSFISFT